MTTCCRHMVDIVFGYRYVRKCSSSRISRNRLESRLRHHPSRHAPIHTTDIPRRVGIANDPLPSRGHIVRATPVKRRLSCVHNYDWHAVRRQPVLSSVVHSLPGSSTSRPSITPSDAPTNRRQPTAGHQIC